jgi:hypothetical protein
VSFVAFIFFSHSKETTTNEQSENERRNDPPKSKANGQKSEIAKPGRQSKNNAMEVLALKSSCNFSGFLILFISDLFLGREGHTTQTKRRGE